MGHWGWRPLVVSTFFSVWVAGCNLLSDSAASTQPPSPYPPVTLTVGRASRASPPAPTLALATATPAASEPAPVEPTSPAQPTASVYLVQPGDTALDIALAAGIDLLTLREANGGQSLSILQIGQSLVIPPPSAAPHVASLPTTAPIALDAESPTCIPDGANGALCLGLVRNVQSVAAANVQLDLRIDRVDGGHDTLTLALEQNVVPAGGSAPYRARVPLSPDAIANITATVSGADPAADPPAIDIQDPQLAYQGGRALVQATLHNPGETSLDLARAVVTLLAADGRVLGYRVVPLDGRLHRGREVPFSATVVVSDEAGLLPRPQIVIEAAPVGG